MMYGILGYGSYVPRYRISLDIVFKHWGLDRANRRPPIVEKSVPGEDEDAITMAVEAGRAALRHAQTDGTAIECCLVGSESKPYATKPSAIVIGNALGATPNLSGGDIEFACKGGTEALRGACCFVRSGAGAQALVIGTDTAQARPGDELEAFTAAGAAAFVVGSGQAVIATLDDFVSYASDTPDFFRREQQPYSVHGHRFTGEPSYFKHSIAAARMLLDRLGASPQEFDYAVFHQPTPRFASELGNELGFSAEQIAPAHAINSLIGNTYAACTLLGLAATLDVANPGERIFCVSYGSGAGSDAFCVTVKDAILGARANRVPLSVQVRQKTAIIDYARYLQHTGHLQRGSS